MLDMNNKLVDELNILKIGNMESKSKDLRSEIFDDLFNPLLHLKECLKEHHKDYKRVTGKICEIRIDVIEYSYSYGVKFLENLQKHISLGNVKPKYKNHTISLKECLLNLDSDIQESKLTYIWKGEDNFVRLIEPTEKLIEMLKYDFNFQI